MKRIAIRIIEGVMGMIAIVVVIHLLFLGLWPLMSFFLWENPIDCLIRGCTNLWKPIGEGWNILNRVSLALLFCSGLLVTGLKVAE